jgi:hypothetical protein
MGIFCEMTSLEIENRSLSLTHSYDPRPDGKQDSLDDRFTLKALYPERGSGRSDLDHEHPGKA